MPDIYLVTPPDKLFNQNYSILLVYPSNELKSEVQDILSHKTQQINVYLYDPPNENSNIPWLLEAHRMCDLVMLDIDFVEFHVREIVSYMISFTNTYWKSQGENLLYNKLSCNRFFHCEEISALKQDTGETIQKIL